MLEIIPNLDDKLLALYCKKCGKLHGPSYYLYLAIDRGETLAAGLFEVESDQVNVVYYESVEEDPYLFDAVLRAGLNYAAEHGITKGHLPEPFRSAHRAFFAKLNYPPQSTFDITNFFRKYKSCI
ncbi:MAG: hypothetical protein ACOX0K_09600 [Oscillospiraceae bacterium]|jgi:hypothetical protein